MSEVVDAQPVEPGQAGGAPVSRRSRAVAAVIDVLGAVLGGVLFLGVFGLAYNGIDPDLYRNRDDAIITVSHARNLVEYGVIGINPAGERVEGFSSPLQFLIFAPLYAALGLHYDPYFVCVAAVSIFLMGALVYRLCLPRRVAGLAACGGTAWVLTRDPSFLEWHASGMENALVHGFFLLTVAALSRMFVDGRIRYLWLLPVLAASISRIEAIYHIGPILFLFALFWLVRYRQGGGAKFAFAAAGLWAAFFAARWWYFGEVFPNTAAAQSISIGDRLDLLVQRDPAYLRQSLGLAKRLFLMHHGWLLVPALLCLPWMRWDRRTVMPVVLLLSLAATGLLSPYVFGEARLDATRVSTQSALAIAVLLAVAAAHARSVRMLAATALIAATGAGATAYWNAAPPYYLWFSEKVFAPYRTQLLALDEKYDVPRPTVANADLGLMSWHKDFNIVDLGMLGSPVLTRLKDPREIANYFLDIAAPDLVEMHGIWSIQYAHLFKDPRFQDRYIAEKAVVDAYLKKRLTRSPGFAAEYGDVVRSGYWVRRDMIAGSPSRERALVDALRKTPDPALIERELERCFVEGLGGGEAMYVVRAAYRFLPEFVAAGDYDTLVDMLERHAAKLHITAMPILARTFPDWEDGLIDFVRAYTLERPRRVMDAEYARLFPAAPRDPSQGRSIAPGLDLEGFRVEPREKGQMRIHLAFRCTTAISGDWRIFLHGEVPPAERAKLPAAQRGTGFLNWDPGFPDPPTSTWHRFPHVIVSRDLPNAKFASQLRLGLHLPGRGVLGKIVTLPKPSAEPVAAALGR